jgi:hypothetical protein
MNTQISWTKQMSRKAGDLSTADFYKFYKTLYKGKAKYQVSKNLYTKILNLYNQKLAKAVLTGEFVKLPYKLSVIRIKKCKMSYKVLKYDYDTYNKTGQKVYHLNEHTKDFYARWYWRKGTCKIKGKLFYSFKPTRDNARNLAKILKSDKHAINKFSK